MHTWSPEKRCTEFPAGRGRWATFTCHSISAAGQAIIDEHNPNAQLLFDIVSPEQVAENVMYFDVVLSGEQRDMQFVITEQEYDKWAEQCIKDNGTYTVKELTMTGSGKDYAIQLNFVDNVIGSFEYREHMVARSGTI